MSYVRKCFLTLFFLAFKAPIKYFESAPPELGRSGYGKRTIFKSSLTCHTFFGSSGNFADEPEIFRYYFKKGVAEGQDRGWDELHSFHPLWWRA